MLVYPTRESKTHLTFLPPVSLAIVAISLVLYLAVFQPKHHAYETQRIELKKRLLDAVAEEVDAKKIDYAVIEKVRQNPDILTHPDYAHLSFVVKNAYRALKDWEPPLIALKQSQSWDHYLLALMPHSIWFLLLTLVFLPTIGFVFEHLYQSIIFGVIFICSGVALSLLSSFFPEEYWPDPIFMFSYSVATLILLGWIVAPNAIITFDLKAWFFKSFQHKIVLPSSVIPLLFFPGFIADGFYGSAYSQFFQPQAMVAIPILAVLFALMLIPLPTREGMLEKDPHTVVNTKLTQVELLLEQEKLDGARQILEELVNDPLDMEQIMRIADLAWQTNQRDICERCYLKALRIVLPARSFQKMLPIVETMTFRHLSVPASALCSTIELGLREKHFQEIKNLLPYLQDHPDVTRQDRDRIFEKVVDFNLSNRQPDDETLLQLRQWLGEDEESTPLREKIEAFFQNRADQETPVVGVSFAYQVNRHVDIELLDVATDHVRLQVKETQPQNVPWTAVLAIYGSHLTSQQRGYRGCIFIRFKRKIFGCHFSNADVLMTEREGVRVSFESAWRQLQEQTPEDIPFRAFEDFEDFDTVDEHLARAQEFLTTSLS